MMGDESKCLLVVSTGRFH